mmetsp:Transcript_60113/g.106412  ORF Transcript_60113/g.106412 Transcript_60113/m.106412 type:complete len:133 (-) Transcript_60113:185-583(-)
MSTTPATPSEVNQLPDELLRERASYLARDPPNTESLSAALVPFATYGLVFRIHEEVARLNNSGQCIWNKQATVARVMGSVTGVTSKHSMKEWEYICNAVDARLRHYCRDLVKAKETDKNPAKFFGGVHSVGV